MERLCESWNTKIYRWLENWLKKSQKMKIYFSLLVGCFAFHFCFFFFFFIVFNSSLCFFLFFFFHFKNLSFLICFCFCLFVWFFFVELSQNGKYFLYYFYFIFRFLFLENGCLVGMTACFMIHSKWNEKTKCKIKWKKIKNIFLVLMCGFFFTFFSKIVYKFHFSLFLQKAKDTFFETFSIFSDFFQVSNQNMKTLSQLNRYKQLRGSVVSNARPFVTNRTMTIEKIDATSGGGSGPTSQGKSFLTDSQKYFAYAADLSSIDPGMLNSIMQCNTILTTTFPFKVTFLFFFFLI